MFTESNLTEDFFAERLKNNTSYGVHGIPYFVKYNKLEYLNDISNILLINHRRKEILGNIVDQSESFAIEVLNNKELVKEIDKEKLDELGTYLDSTQNDIFYKTEIYKKFKKIL